MTYGASNAKGRTNKQPLPLYALDSDLQRSFFPIEIGAVGVHHVALARSEFCGQRMKLAVAIV